MKQVLIKHLHLQKKERSVNKNQKRKEMIVDFKRNGKNLEFNKNVSCLHHN